MLATIFTTSRLFPNFKPSLSTFSLVRTLSPSSASRFQVRSMASSSPFKKIQIQREDTVSLSFEFDITTEFWIMGLPYLVVLINGFLISYWHWCFEIVCCRVGVWPFAGLETIWRLDNCSKWGFFFSFFFFEILFNQCYIVISSFLHFDIQNY